MARILVVGYVCALAATLCATANAQIAPLHRERQDVIAATYRATLGRNPSSAELYYWELYPDTPAGIVNARTLFAALLQTLRNSRAEREATARRALDTVFAAEERGNKRARAYIDDVRNPPLRRAIADLLAQREGGGYRGLVAWLSRPAIRQHFVMHTGTASVLVEQAR